MVAIPSLPTLSSSEKELHAAIRALTTVLEGIRPHDTRVSNKPSKSTKTFVHLAQLLDHSPQQVMAITGYAGYPTSHAFLVVPDSYRKATVPEGLAYSVEQLEAKEVSGVDWAEAKTPFPITTRTLAQSLLWVLQELGSLPPENTGSFISAAGVWFLRACWKRYHSRMTTTLTSEWKTSPMASMEQWKPQPADLDVLRPFDRTELRLTANEASSFKPMKPKVVGSELVVVFRVEEATLWVRLIARLLRQCTAPLGKYACSDDGLPIGFDPSDGLLPILFSLLRFPPTKVLFAQTSLGNMFHRRTGDTLQEQSEAQPEAQSKAESEVEDENKLSEEHLEDLMGDAKAYDAHRGPPDGIRRDGVLVFRFLEALVAPHSALVHLARPECIALFKNDVQLTLIRLARPQHKDTHVKNDICPRMRADMQQAVDDASKEAGFTKTDPEALKWLDARLLQAGVGSRSNVHAVAGVMAISCAQSPPSFMKLESSNILPIGVSKKCCWTCSKLAQLLQTGNDPNVKFDLPGSHGSIHAWSPPAFGIPIDILSRLRVELLREVGKAALNAAQERKSRASSPASVSGEIPTTVLMKGRIRRSVDWSENEDDDV